MIRGKRLLVLAMVGALVATGCADDGDGDTTDGADTTTDGGTDDAGTDDGEAAGPRSVTVQVDGESEAANVAMLGYFPRETTVRQGDSVEFAFQPGDPHSVTFGGLVDQALDEMASGEEPATMDQIPLALSPDGSQVIQAGALPCFTDAPPTDGSACEDQEQPEFSGSLDFYSSGLLEPNSTFKVDIAADAEPGTYNFICTLHGPDMSGSVTVVEADGEGQTAAEVEAAAEAEVSAAANAAQQTVASLEDGAQPGLEEVLPEGEDQLIAGGFARQPVPIDILEFWPSETTVSAGESVTWNVVGFHTISFNAPQDATPPIMLDEEGMLALNPLAFAPQGGAAGAPPPPEGGEQPPEQEGPPPPPTVIDAGEFDGDGFFSSGFLPSVPPNLLAYEITFTTPGTYNYVCTIHPGMEGTITVT